MLLFGFLHSAKCAVSSSGRPVRTLPIITAPQCRQTDSILVASCKSLRSKPLGGSVASDIIMTCRMWRMLSPDGTESNRKVATSSICLVLQLSSSRQRRHGRSHICSLKKKVGLSVLHQWKECFFSSLKCHIQGISQCAETYVVALDPHISGDSYSSTIWERKVRCAKGLDGYLDRL
jgi:hypothetical protein